MNGQMTKFIGCLLPLLLLRAFDVQAQDDRAMARAQQMLRQLNAEKSQLQQEIAQLRQEYADYRADMEKSLAAAESKQKNLSESIVGLTRDGKQLDRELESVQQSLKREQAVASQLQNQLQVQTENLELCKHSNAALADTAYDLIGLYQDKGFRDVLSNREPVTGIAKVKVENIVQTFADRVIENQLELNSHRLRDPQTPQPGKEVAGETREE